MKNLLKDYGSPLYVYDYEVLMDRCNQIANFKNNLEKSLNGIKVSMHYSTKANNNPAILKIVKECGLSVDCMSPLELSLNEKCGFSKENMLYVCNNIDENEMKLVHDKGLLICLDSISQVDTWGNLFPNTDIMVRINPGTTGVGHSEKVITSGKSSKFGVSEENIPELLNVAQKYNINIIGIHQHLGSLFLDDKISNYIAGVKAGLRIVKEYFKNISIIDLGGGFGVPYMPGEKPLNFNLVEQDLVEVLKDFCNEYSSIKEFKFEPGRFIPCEAGKLVGTVTAVKHENGKWWIGTDIGMNQLVRPSMYDSYHQVHIISDNTEKVIANVCGNVCESGDILAKDRELILPSVGDIIVVDNAGAYGYSMASNYTGRCRPAEVMIKNEEHYLIRKRETLDYLEANIVWNN